jgi:glycosyltransferase involved in cell wall biosynthesis
MKVTVVITTYNRQKILEKAIRAYLHQRRPLPDFEMLVVDDGSTDGTEEAVARHTVAAAVPIRFFRQENRGLAAARNSGIRRVDSEILLFVDDDIIPSEDLVAEHLRWHEEHPQPNVAVLGRTVWSPEIHVTPFMKWYGQAGALLDLRGIERKIELDAHHFYGGHMSLKPDFLRRNGMYDEGLKTYGWEDFELGYRLFQRGLRLLYNPAAVGYHHQSMTFADACRRAQKAEASRRALEQRDAGRYLAELKRQRNSRLAWRVGQRLLEGLVPVLSPLKFMFDSDIPLPEPVYRSFYWYYGTRLAEQQKLGSEATAS